MSETLRKIKRLQPILADRKKIVDEELFKLSQIRRTKHEIVRLMRESQKNYVQGIDRLNQERMSSTRNMLSALEIGLDVLKQQWLDYYKDLMETEQLEVKQMDAVQEAQQKLEALQALEGKYQQEHKTHVNKAEQKQLDEFALRKHIAS
jgi:flagellar biosynthesis chaperone FliJ